MIGMSKKRSIGAIISLIAFAGIIPVFFFGVVKGEGIPFSSVVGLLVVGFVIGFGLREIKKVIKSAN